MVKCTRRGKWNLAKILNLNQDCIYRNNLKYDNDLEMNFNNEFNNRYLSCKDKISFKNINKIYAKVKNYIYNYFNSIY